jgi:hypothetical protein
MTSMNTLGKETGIDERPLESFEWESIGSPVLSEKGMQLQNAPPRFKLRNRGSYNGYEVIAPQSKYPNLGQKPIILSEAEVRYALAHQHFARVGYDKLIVPVRNRSKKKPKKNARTPTPAQTADHPGSAKADVKFFLADE